MRPTTAPKTRRTATLALIAIAAAALTGAALSYQPVASTGPGSPTGVATAADLDPSDPLGGTQLWANVSFVEASAGTLESAGDAVVGVRTSEDSTFTSVEVTYNVTGGTAGTADVSGGDGTLTFNESDQTRWIRMDLLDDEGVEGDETVVLNLSSEDALVTFDVREHTHTILDDDYANRAPQAGSLSVEISAGSSYEGQLPADDPDGDALRWSVAVEPAQGTLSVDASSGAFTYVPDPGASGTDAFDFRVSDGETTDRGKVDVSIASTGSGDDGGQTGDGAGDGDAAGTADGDGDGTSEAGDRSGDAGSDDGAAPAEGESAAQGDAREAGHLAATLLGWVGILGGAGVTAYAYVKDRSQRFPP